MGIFKALSFLTVIRITSAKICDDREIAGWGRYYFLVGLFIGAVAGGIDYLLLERLSNLVVATVIVAFISLINGGLHLDGLIDTFDAAFSMKSKEEKLAIMKESGVGAFGVVAIIFVILLKVALIADIPPGERFKMIAVFPAVSRGCLLFPALLFSYPRDEGKGKGFVSCMTPGIVLTGTLISAAVMYLILGVKGLMVLAASAVFGVIIAFIFNRKIGGITGDVLGAVNELIEIFVLFFAAFI